MSKAKFVVGSQRLQVFAERRARVVRRVVGENQRANLRTFPWILFTYLFLSTSSGYSDVLFLTLAVLWSVGST